MSTRRSLYPVIGSIRTRVNRSLIAMSEQQKLAIPISRWDSLYDEGRHADLTYQLLYYIYNFGKTLHSQISLDLRTELNEFLLKFSRYLTRPDFGISNSDLLLFIQLNGTLAYLTACSDFENTDEWLKILVTQGASDRKIMALYSLRNRYRPPIDRLFEEEPEMASLWYAAQFKTTCPPAKRWLMQNARDLFAAMPEEYRIMSPDCIMAGYFDITYLDPENERPYKQKLHAAIRRICPDIHLECPRNRKSIAVITRRWFGNSAVYRALYPYLENLGKDYKLTLVNLARPGRHADTSLFSSVMYFPPLVDIKQLSAEQMRVIENQDWGAVFYPDVGMDAETIYLSNCRLAPVQIMGYGHPASTHGAEIDYFIAGQESELPELAAEYFSERLVLLPGIGMIPVWPRMSLVRPAQRGHGNTIIINCPWTLLKINADIIDVLGEIAGSSSVPIRYRFFAGHDVAEMGAHPVYVRDLEDLLGADTFELHGLMSYQQFLVEMSLGDMTLVPYPFGGFNTVIDSLYVGVPALAWEGTHGYNRFPPALLRRAGLPELVALNRSEYVAKALRLIQDSRYRAEISSKIERADLDRRILSDLDPGVFKRAIDYLMDNHELLKNDLSREPIIIS